MARSTIHYLATSDDVRTACAIHLYAASNRRAPTNPQHVTCGGCQQAMTTTTTTTTTTEGK